MKNRPQRLDWYAFFLALIAISMPVQIMLLYGHGPTEVGAIAAKLAPLNWLILFSAPFTAWLIRRASKLALVAVPALAALIVYNNWLVAQAGDDYGPEVVALASLGFLISMASVFNRDTLSLFFEPGLRWWLTPERLRAQVPVRVKVLGQNYRKTSFAGGGGVFARGKHDLGSPQTGQRLRVLSTEFYARTFDLSESGAFIPVTMPGMAIDFRTLSPGSQCYVTMGLRGMNLLQCRAEIVRAVAPRGEYPAGVGIRFLGLSWSEQRRLKGFLRDLKVPTLAA